MLRKSDPDSGDGFFSGAFRIALISQKEQSKVLSLILT